MRSKRRMRCHVRDTKMLVLANKNRSFPSASVTHLIHRKRSPFPHWGRQRLADLCGSVFTVFTHDGSARGSWGAKMRGVSSRFASPLDIKKGLSQMQILTHLRRLLFLCNQQKSPRTKKKASNEAKMSTTKRGSVKSSFF